MAFDTLIKNKKCENLYVQIGKEKQIHFADEFKVLYNLGLVDDYQQAAAFCLTHDIHVVSIEMKRVLSTDDWKILTDHGIRVYAHTVNRLEDYHKLKEMGVTGVFTDYLIPDDLDAIAF